MGRLPPRPGLRPFLAILAPVTLLACTDPDPIPDPPPDPPACAAPEEPGAFAPCTEGAGDFGTWIVDAEGLPALRYTGGPGGEWTLSDGSVRDDHFVQLGNDRLLFVADSGGFVQLLARDRVPTLVDRLDRAHDRTAGGYSYVLDGDGVWATAAALAPDDAVIRQTWGVGYARHAAEHGGLAVTHELMAPAGDAPYLVDRVTVVNRRPTPRSLVHVEFWDVNRHSLELQLLRSGTTDPSIPAVLDAVRDGINDEFSLQVVVEGDRTRVVHTYVADEAPPGPDQRDGRDYHPLDMWLERLDGPAAIATDRAAFLGGGGPARPDGVAADLDSPVSAAGQPAILADVQPLFLGPYDTAELVYAFGFGDGAAAPTTAGELASAWREVLPYFVVPGDPALHREMAWHAAQLLGASVQEDYFDAHATVQGSAYFYLHGLDGAARDYALFAVPETYLRPDLARDNLRTIMAMTHAADGQISYAVQGYGMAEDAVIHTHPSDLDLFFLWALAEYLAATGDLAFLDEQRPYWPREAASGTVREHARTAFRHLVDEVGVGSHGLIRVHTGDWSDGICFEAPSHDQCVEQGESVPNTQMAAWVLPRVAWIFDDGDPALAAEIRAYGEQMRTEAAEEWIERWYRRAWWGPDEPFGEGHCNLESQVWALIAGIPDEQQTATLLDAIWDELDSTSEVGAPLWAGGDVWHAVTGLLTWGYGRSDPARAEAALSRHTMRTYAEVHPDQWYGTWSGPDGIGAGGGTWASEVTPMTDWPVGNANQHAMPLLAMLRLAGIEPAEDGGLVIDPVLDELKLRTPLLDLDVTPDRIAGTYRAATDGRTRLVFPGTGEQPLDLVFAAGDEIPFEWERDGR